MVNSQNSNSANNKLRSIVSRVLSVGYYVSIIITLAGLILHLAGAGSWAVTVIKAGLLILLATPLLRVVTAVLVFYFIEQDKKYALISLAVLLILTVSIFIGREF